MNNSLEVRLLRNKEQSLWDKFTKDFDTGCFMQSGVWADFKELEGYQTFRYGLFDNNTLVGGCIFYYYPDRNRPNILFAPGAPIVLSEYLELGLQLLIKQAEKLAKQLNIIALRIEPLWQEKPKCLQEFSRSPADLLPCETLLINLQQTEAKLLVAMKPKGRYNLRLSQRYQVTTEFTKDSQAISLFYNLFWTTVQRHKFFGEPYSFFINLCQTLFQADVAEIGFAKWQGEILVSIIVVYWGKRATYLYGGSQDKYRHVMPAYTLHWDAMLRAKKRGCEFYDFYGFTTDNNHNYANFSQFKSQFGGEKSKTIGAQDYFFYDRFAETLVTLINKLYE
ncbi:conserved hypothetical protein [Hyella patelloides LEGE 07179]|uniref:Methicillin resistance protein n=1 Tax=Hyella patelloides LEGE 07179 TaxID=945734 RepID=A0A563VL93_9CYAN|nr:peptidoglycan bridge formation glycyltransferase FemA/FemB family protein [Hyella patelloides]VEP12103.1 conserved hypothetical protein [Hyella patelloides LEGE 07179]